MPERLVCFRASGANQPSSSVGTARPRRLRVSRRFGRPPVNLKRQRLFLELDQVRGIHLILLNGKAQSGISASKSYYLIPLAEIDERNTLILEVETGESAAAGSDSGQEWGQIAILVRPIDFPPLE